MYSKANNTQYQELYIPYCISKTCPIVSPMVSLLSCNKPESGFLLCSQNVELASPDLIRRVVWEININTDLFVLIFFCICSIYMYTTPYLRLQTHWTYIECPVEGESEDCSCFSDNSNTWLHPLFTFFVYMWSLIHVISR